MESINWRNEIAFAGVAAIVAFIVAAILRGYGAGKWLTAGASGGGRQPPRGGGDRVAGGPALGHTVSRLVLQDPVEVLAPRLPRSSEGLPHVERAGFVTPLSSVGEADVDALRRLVVRLGNYPARLDWLPVKHRQRCRYHARRSAQGQVGQSRGCSPRLERRVVGEGCGIGSIYENARG